MSCLLFTRVSDEGYRRGKSTTVHLTTLSIYGGRGSSRGPGNPLLIVPHADKFARFMFKAPTYTNLSVLPPQFPQQYRVALKLGLDTSESRGSLLKPTIFSPYIARDGGQPLQHSPLSW